MAKDVTVINPTDHKTSFWRNNYRIALSAQGIEYLVNADCTQDAIDELIDWLEDNAPGLLWDREEEAEQEFLGDYISGGNHGRYLSTLNVLITKEDSTA